MDLITDFTKRMQELKTQKAKEGITRVGFRKIGFHFKLCKDRWESHRKKLGNNLKNLQYKAGYIDGLHYACEIMTYLIAQRADCLNCLKEVE